MSRAKKFKTASVTLKRAVKTVIAISDTHFGCRFGLCPPDGVELDGGGVYVPSRFQKVVWGWWEEFWGEWVPQITKGEPYVVVHNGDVVEGVHHGATTQISHCLGDQGALAVKVLKPIFEKCEGRYYSIRGTASHVGPSSIEEERVAKAIGAIPNKDGQHARFELWKKLGSHLIHFLHHIGTTSSSAHESSAVNAELTAEFVESCRWGEQPPSVIVRSHRHRAIEVRLPTSAGYATAVVTPAWQLKTPYVFRVAGGRLSPPQLGGIAIKLDSEDNHIYTSSFVKHISRDEPE